MSEGILNKTTLYVVKEVEEGTYLEPQSGSDAISAQEDGSNDFIIPTKEILERSNLNANIIKGLSRSGKKSASGTISVELKAGDNAGAPEYSPLVESALGSKIDAETAVDIPVNSNQVNHIEFDTKDNHLVSEFIVLQAVDGTKFGVMLDKTGTDAEPEVSAWTSISVGNTVTADISADTTAIEVATTVTTALNTITDIELKLTIAQEDDEGLTGTIIITQVAQGQAINPISYKVDGTVADKVTLTTATAGVLNTTTVLFCDTTDLNIGDIVVMKNSTDKILHVSPITSKDTTKITILVPFSGTVTHLTSVKKVLQYVVANSGHPSFSVTSYITSSDTNHVRTYVKGAKTTSMSLEDFSTGQQPKLSFGYEALGFDRDLESPDYTPVYDASMPIIALCVKVFKDSTLMESNELSISLENTLGFRDSITSCNGRTKSFVTAMNITGHITPYKEDDSIVNYEAWLNDTPFSLFGWAFNPDSDGNPEEIVAFYLPKCQFTEIAQSDIDGLLQDNMPFSAKDDTNGAFRIAFC